MAQNPPLASIQVIAGKQMGRTFPIQQALIKIGREPSNDIVLEDMNVSRYHAQLMRDGSQWYIRNITDNNTITLVNSNIHATPKAPLPTPLRDGDTICFGVQTSVRFASHASAAPSISSIYTPPPSPGTSPPPPPGATGQQGHLQTMRAGSGIGGIAIPQLEITMNTQADKATHPLGKNLLNIGRDPSNDIVIASPVVSSFHAQILDDGKNKILIHPHPKRAETTNGLIYQGRHIRGNEQVKQPLNNGDMFRIGDENGTFVTLVYSDGRNMGMAQVVAPAIRPIQLGAPILTLGRMSDNMVVLNHPQVSAHHAKLQMEQGTYRIIDLGSTNHTYINNRRISSELLKPQDEIRIGPFKLTYTGQHLTQQDESKCIRIDAYHLKKYGDQGKVLLQDISLSIPPRKFVALVGGSGAGKSTLMDTLNGFRRANEGQVLYNGQDYYTSLAAFSTQLGYVPQEDIVHRDLSVERVLYYAAKMRLPEDYTNTQIAQRIDEVLAEVDMTDRRKLLVAKLSGGQRKRVSIAMELLAQPSVFFLDEPTSGLDPGLDRKMMFLLRKLADKGHTIVLVTHATNNITSCDYVCFMATGGYLAYFGPPNEAKKFFGKSDFAEIYGELEPEQARPNIVQEAAQKFKQSQDYQQHVASLLSQGSTQLNRPQQHLSTTRVKRGNPQKQFSLLCQRYIELLWNDKRNLWILLLQAPVIAMLLVFFILAAGTGGFEPNNVVQCPATQQILTPAGVPDIPTPSNPPVSTDCTRIETFLTSDPRGQAYANTRGGEKQALQDFIQQDPGNAPKLLFIMAFAAVMFGCVNGSREIVKEAAIYRRERTVNLGILPYVFSKIVVLGVLCLIQSLVLVTIISLFDHFQEGVIGPAFIEVYITLCLTSLAGLMVGLTLSAIVPTNDSATSLIPIILIPQVIFAGVLFPLKNFFMQVLGFLFPIRWAMAALGTSIGLHSEKLGGDAIIGDNATYHGKLFSIYSSADSAGYLILMWFVLLVMIVALGWATVYFLKRKERV